MKNLINRIARFVFRGVLIQVEMTDPETGKVTRIQRYIGKEALRLMQARAQQELRMMHQAALEQQIKAAAEKK